MTRSTRATAAAPSPAEPRGQVRDWADDPLVPFRFRRGDTEVEALWPAGAVEAAKEGRVVPVTIVFGDKEVHTAWPAATARAVGLDRKPEE